jgi:ComF family protein
MRAMPVTSVMNRLLRRAPAALDLLLPPTCPTCNETVDAPDLFCVDCFGKIGFATEPCCAVCGVMFAYAAQGGPDGLCPGCRAGLPVFSRGRAAFRYGEHARRMILPFKHADRTEAARVLAAFMARAGAALLRDADVLIPIPLHRSRLLARRYNQAALLAWSLRRHCGLPVLPDALIRRRATPSLGHMTAAERIVALSGVIAVRPSRIGRIDGRRALLIDDVMASGATANACAMALRQAGAADVLLLVAARVPDPRLG